MQDFGCPATEPSGLIDVGVSPSANECWGTLVTARPSVVKKLNRKDQVVEDKEVEKDLVFPFKVRVMEPGVALLEVYAGGAKSIQVINDFVSGSLGVAFEAACIPVNMLARFAWLRTSYEKAALKAAKVSGYQHSEQVTGMFTSRFASTQDGIEFIEKINAGGKAMVTNITVAFKCKAQNMTVKITLSREASFSYSCDEDSTQEIGRVVRDLANVGGAQ
jgi:hypothetical protein